MKSTNARLCIVSGLFCIGGIAEVYASPNEVPIDTAGSVGFVALAFGSHTLNAALSLGTEVDGYTFNAVAGDQISLVTSTSTAGLDAVVLLRDPNGVVLANTSCNGHGGFQGGAVVCAVDLQRQLAATGTYTLNLSDSGANNVGAYTLHLDRYPPVNNWLGFAYGAPTQYAIDHLGDSDYFAFNVNAGSGFRLTVATLTAGVDAHVEVWDAGGALIQTTGCNGHGGFQGSAITCNVLLDLTASVSGFYKVGVYDSGWDNNGNYQIGVTCLFGACATGVPSPIPELPTRWMLCVGVTLLAWRRLGRA